MEHIEEDSPKPSTSTGVTHEVSSRAGRTVKSKEEVFKVEDIESDGDAVKNDTQVLVSAVIHDHLVRQVISFHKEPK